MFQVQQAVSKLVLNGLLQMPIIPNLIKGNPDPSGRDHSHFLVLVAHPYPTGNAIDVATPDNNNLVHLTSCIGTLLGVSLGLALLKKRID